ncbi:hypothetical protein [Rubritalea tangerina]|uniref:Tetratricopeptide repeat protein n=1 Tax=Rubritalea tangerina TaxID=430798 RepID=A0ABW4ZC34_9BACT
MRIHWSISSILAICVFGSVLWFGAKNHDFTTPPTESEITHSLDNWKKKHPSLPPRKHPIPPPKEISPKTPSTPTPKKPPRIPLGDLDTRPSLDHFHQHRDFSAQSFTQLAIELESRGKIEHALLAWERVIDTTDATASESKKARQAIASLHSALPIWNADSTTNFDTVFHIHTPEPLKAEASALISQLTEEIKNSSSFLIAPQVLIKTSPQRDGFPPPPLRIWLSATGDSPKETPQLTIRLTEGDAPLSEQLYMAIYRSIAGQLQQDGTLMPPASISTEDSPQTALTTYLTRLHWKRLVETLTTETSPSPPAVIIIEENTDSN